MLIFGISGKAFHFIPYFALHKHLKYPIFKSRISFMRTIRMANFIRHFDYLMVLPARLIVFRNSDNAIAIILWGFLNIQCYSRCIFPLSHMFQTNAGRFTPMNVSCRDVSHQDVSLRVYIRMDILEEYYRKWSYKVNRHIVFNIVILAWIFFIYIRIIYMRRISIRDSRTPIDRSFKIKHEQRKSADNYE
jgi:hypothetical protein